MRELVIKRAKSFAGCFGKVHIYIKDAAAAELDIQGAPCRKLGELKNGEEKTFLIPTTPVQVFVIGDASTRDFCVDGVALPAGDQAVRLSGKIHLDPQRGNPFLFDR